MMLRAIGLAAALLISGGAQAQFISGNRLLSDMSSDLSVNRSFARGYITGVADSHDGTEFCIDQDANVGQLSDIVQTFLQRHPKVRHMHGAALVSYALSEVFPCEKGGA